MALLPRSPVRMRSTSSTWVSPTGACILGAVAGVLVIVGMEVLEYLRIDDPVGAWPVHGVCGIWGTISLGLFASGEYQATGSSPFGVPSIVPNSPEALTGLFYGGGTKVLMAQCIGSLIVCTATFASAMAMFYVLNLMSLLRVSEEGEIEGFDIDQHGISAYPDYQIAPWASPGHTMASGHSMSASHRVATTGHSVGVGGR
jgi:ammonium transporter, Amt family